MEDFKVQIHGRRTVVAQINMAMNLNLKYVGNWLV